MSEHLPYDERDRQFDDVPLPDREASWQKMKKLLDEDDDSGAPLLFLPGCLGWAFLLAGLTLAWLLVRPERWWTGKENPTSTSAAAKVPDKRVVTKGSTGNNSKSSIPVAKGGRSDKDSSLNQIGIVLHPKKTVALQPEKIVFPATLTGEKKWALQPSQQTIRAEERMQTPGINNPETITAGEKQRDIRAGDPVMEKGDTTGRDKPLLIDKAVEERTKPSADTSAVKKIKKRPKEFILVAGIGEQQQIPIAGQKAVPYSHYGRKGSLSDYIPSVFVQLRKENKWFVLGEFRYGAAQSVKEFSYNRKTVYDTASRSITTTTMRLKKTYYHQFPFSFNYHLAPAFSVGVGGMYSRFHAAVTEKEISRLNTQSQTITTFKEIIPVKQFTDSFLFKTQLHFFVQADYHWRKFSIGLRYARDIQPYIKYTKTDGSVEEDKNQSLQLIVRYRLWPFKK